MDLVRTVEFGAIQRDQDLTIKAAHGIEAAALLKLGQDIGEHRVKHGRFDSIELGADLTVAWDLAHAKQCFAVRPALAGLQMALVREKRRALHEERRKRAEREIGHGIGRVPALPPVRQNLAAAAQRIEQAVLD